MKPPHPTFIAGLQPVIPHYTLTQEDSLRWLMRALLKVHGSSSGRKVARALDLYERLLRAPNIKTRKVFLADYTHEEWSRMELYEEEAQSPFYLPSLEKRMALYSREANQVVFTALEKFERPDYLVQVSCTGYESPHAIQNFASHSGWGDKVQCLHLGHMGCYASIPAVGMASQLLGGDAHRVVLFFNEFCSLHLRPSVAEADQVVINSLFADGTIALKVTDRSDSANFEVLSTTEQILPNTADQMTWRLSNSNFAMTLSRKVPRSVAAALQVFVQNFLSQCGVSLEAIAYVAIHPGGPKIIDSVEESLQLKADQSRHSRQLLRERGNMSSSSLPHIWYAMSLDNQVKAGDKILSLAFGPGLTMAANLMQKC